MFLDIFSTTMLTFNTFKRFELNYISVNKVYFFSLRDTRKNHGLAKEALHVFLGPHLRTWINLNSNMDK